MRSMLMLLGQGISRLVLFLWHELHRFWFSQATQKPLREHRRLRPARAVPRGILRAASVPLQRQFCFCFCFCVLKGDSLQGERLKSTWLAAREGRATIGRQQLCWSWLSVELSFWREQLRVSTDSPCEQVFFVVFSNFPFGFGASKFQRSP